MFTLWLFLTNFRWILLGDQIENTQMMALRNICNLSEIGFTSKANENKIENQEDSFISESRSVSSLSCDPKDCSMPGLHAHHQLPELTQTHVHWVGDAI